MKGSKEGERWRQLYDLNEKRKKDKEELKKMYEDEDAKKQQCTFRPQLIGREGENENQKDSQSPGQGKKNVEGVQERNMLWQKKKEDKIKMMKDNGEDKDLVECTFQPHLVATSAAHMAKIEKEEPNQSNSSTDAFIASMKSVEKYIEKQKSLRDQKEQTQKKAENYTGSGTISEGSIL